MVSILGSLIINTIAFLMISKFLPGFKVRTDGTAAVIAVVYGIVMALCTRLLAGVMLSGVVFLVAVFPPLGVLAGMLTLMALPAMIFVLSVVALIATDHFIEDFEMDSKGTALIAAFLLAVINGVARMLI